MNSNSNNFREMYWDESNRLRVVNDNDHQIQHYIYDGAGERILKASSQIETVYENGQVDANTTTMGLYTTYVSPYMVVDANQKYSKHYFNGTQRVASKIGEQDIAIFENGNQYLKQANNKAAENTPATDFDALKNKQITDFSYYLSKSTNNATAKNVKVNYTEYKKADTNTETTSAKEADNNSAFAAPQYAEIYYYHSDHLGTGTFLSDFDGNPYQFFLNLPFGETMAEQHSYSGEYTNRYKFNGKELDEETGFYYYGARYYNPKFSIWLSVDPLAEKFPSHSPYNYCYNNPLNFIDPDGRSGEPVIDKKNKTITVNSTFVFYGSNANTKLSASIANEIAWQYNGAKGSVNVDGVDYAVKFNIHYQTVTVEQATKMAEGNTDVSLNFIRVEENNPRYNRSFNEIGENSGFMNTSDDLGTSTTAPHEIGHGYGLKHPSGDQRGNGQPGIMAARGTAVDAGYTYSPSSGDTKVVKKGFGKVSYENTINPQTRRVTKQNIIDIFKDVKFDSNGRGSIGKATNRIYDSSGYEK